MLHFRWAATGCLFSLLVATTASAQQQPPPEGYQQQPAPAGQQQAPGQYPPPGQAPPPGYQQQGQYPQQQPPPPAAPPEGHDRRSPNSLYGEVLGAGLFYSLNYERLVHPDVAVRIGFSYVSLSASAGSSSSSASYLTFPLTASYLGLGGDHHMFEVGGGVSINYTSAAASAGVSSAEGSGVTPFGVIFAGYRIHPVDSAGFNFRVGIMGLIAQGLSLSDPDPEAVGVLPWFYISFGASF